MGSNPTPSAFKGLPGFRACSAFLTSASNPRGRARVVLSWVRAERSSRWAGKRSKLLPRETTERSEVNPTPSVRLQLLRALLVAGSALSATVYGGEEE